MKVEIVTVGGRQMFRATLGGTVRTAPAPQTLVLLRDAAQAEVARVARLQQDIAGAEARIEAAIGSGASAAEARAEAARLQAEVAGAEAQAARLYELADEVRKAAIEAHAVPLREQHQAALDRLAATLPPIPTLGELLCSST
jgi:hypothetical protein